jgi:hypothetical protein
MSDAVIMTGIVSVTVLGITALAMGGFVKVHWRQLWMEISGKNRATETTDETGVES